MSDSESASSEEFPADRGARRLRNVLFNKQPRRRSRVHTIALEAQGLTDNAKKFISRVTDGLEVEIPEKLRETNLPESVSGGFDTDNHQRFLRDQTCIVIEERKREIEETQRRLEQALQELEITKQEEERILHDKVLECQQEYLDAMTRLQEQFIAQADDLKMATMTQVAQYRSQCETTIESKARALCATLATDSRTRPASPRSSKSSPTATMRSSKHSLLRSRLQGLHNKVATEEETASLSDKAIKRRMKKKIQIADERSDRVPSIYAKSGRETSFRFPTAAPSASNELPRHSSLTRRSFFEFVDSEEEE